MQIPEIIKIFKTLADDTGLSYEENWEQSPETAVWREKAIQAIEEATKIIETGTVVGTIELHGKTYKITE